MFGGLEWWLKLSVNVLLLFPLPWIFYGFVVAFFSRFWVFIIWTNWLLYSTEFIESMLTLLFSFSISQLYCRKYHYTFTITYMVTEKYICWWNILIFWRVWRARVCSQGVHTDCSGNDEIINKKEWLKLQQWKDKYDGDLFEQCYVA